MKRYLILYILATLLTIAPISAQQNKYDRVRYDQMNEQGIWNVGFSMEPVVGMIHPTYGKSTGILGFAVEGGYFVADNMRLSLALGFVNDMWANAFSASDSYYSEVLSQFKVKVGGHWHMGRWDIGGRFYVGNTTYRYDYNPPIGYLEDESNKSYKDRRGLMGVAYEVGYMISPFFKVGGYFEPSYVFGRGYAQAVGLRLTIYLPFINMVTCK